MFVIYIFCLSGWNVKNKKAIFSHFAECNGHDTRQSDDQRTCLGTCFAECKGHCTRQTSQICRVPRARHSANIACLPSVLPVALGTVATFAECLSQRRSAKRWPLPSAWPWHLAKPPSRWHSPSRRLFFAECQISTRQRSDKMHSVKSSLQINCLISVLCRLCRVYIGLWSRLR